METEQEFKERHISFFDDPIEMAKTTAGRDKGWSIVRDDLVWVFVEFERVVQLCLKNNYSLMINGY